MQSVTSATAVATTARANDITLYASLELSKSKWVVTINNPGSEKFSKHVVEAVRSPKRAASGPATPRHRVLRIGKKSALGIPDGASRAGPDGRVAQSTRMCPRSGPRRNSECHERSSRGPDHSDALRPCSCERRR